MEGCMQVLVQRPGIWMDGWMHVRWHARHHCEHVTNCSASAHIKLLRTRSWLTWLTSGPASPHVPAQLCNHSHVNNVAAIPDSLRTHTKKSLCFPLIRLSDLSKLP